MKTFFLILIAVVALMLLWDGARFFFLTRKTALIIKSTVPFSRKISTAPMHILILGDSTAVGTGASKPEDSTAGRLASFYPNAEVVNLAENGMRLAGLNQILAKTDKTKHFDIVLIQIGANDIIRLTSMSDIEKGISNVLEYAQSFGGKVIVLHSGNIGESKFFPWYIRPLLSERSFEVRTIYQKLAADHNASYVDLIDAPVAQLLREDPARYYASDLLHLSSDGYGLWFEEIKKKL